MAANSNNNTNSFSSAGNDPFDLSWLFQYNDSNASLNHPSFSSESSLNLGHDQLGRVTSVTTEVRRTYVSPRSGHQSASFHVPDGTLTHEVVRSTHFFIPQSMMDHMFASSSGVGNQGSTLPTNVRIFNQEQPVDTGQPAEQSQPAVRIQLNMLAFVSNLNRNQVNLSSSVGVRIQEQGQQPIMTNQPYQAVNILNNANQRSSNAHEVIDVHAYDSEVYGNSSRASKNQQHWPNIQVKDDAFSENPSMNLANHGSGSINVHINGGIHENSANASDPLLDNAGQGRGKGRGGVRGQGRGHGRGRGRSADQDGMIDSLFPQSPRVGGGRGRGRGRGQGRANDGRIHSLPRGDRGGYYFLFPNCQNLVFQTAQDIAAHASSIHHSTETSEERRRRAEARFDKRKLSLGLTKSGISVMPDKLNFKPVKLSENQSNSQRENDGEMTMLLEARILSPRFFLVLTLIKYHTFVSGIPSINFLRIIVGTIEESPRTRLKRA